MTDKDNEMWDSLLKTENLHKGNAVKTVSENDIDTRSKDVSTEDFVTSTKKDSSLWEILRNKFIK
jgi:hypothetical protein